MNQMNNPLFSAMNGSQNNIMGMLQRIKSDPVSFLMQYRFNVPQNVKDPNGIINYLLSSGQINQQQVNNAYQMARNFKG